MTKYRVAFDEMPWQDAAPFVRVKKVSVGSRVMRLVEFRRGFVEEEWCAKEHAGYVIDGRMTVEFTGGVTLELREGDGLDMPAGPEHVHKATPLTESVLLILFEPA